MSTDYLSEHRLKMMDNMHSFVPLHMREGFILYINHGIEPGSFATALLANDLMETMGRADHINQHAVKTMCSWLYNFAPEGCHGSYEKVEAWAKARREDNPYDN